VKPTVQKIDDVIQVRFQPPDVFALGSTHRATLSFIDRVAVVRHWEFTVVGRPAGHWRFDEGGGSVAYDGSCHGHHGTLTGADPGDPGWVELPPDQIWGPTGYALDLHGAGYVDFGNPEALSFGMDDWSVCAWIRTTQSGTGDENKGTIFANGGDWTGGVRYAMAVGEIQEGLVSLTTDDDITKVQVTNTSLVNDDQWHHIAGVRDGATLRLYIDGKPDGTGTLPAGYDLSGTSQHNAYIGAITDHRDGSLAKFYSGLIDEARIYGRALSADEIAAIATPPDCFPAFHPDYDEWVEVGKPDCWCYPRQCHGDADGTSQGKKEYWVSTDDLDVLVAAWNKPLESLSGNEICADFDQMPQGKKQYRVSTDDLDILIANWQIADGPAPVMQSSLMTLRY
jgi:hypothetical protein